MFSLFRGAKVQFFSIQQSTLCNFFISYREKDKAIKGKKAIPVEQLTNNN
jgi:hypothetical protein